MAGATNLSDSGGYFLIANHIIQIISQIPVALKNCHVEINSHPLGGVALMIMNADFGVDGTPAEYQQDITLTVSSDLESIDLATDLPITSHGVPYSAETRPELRHDRAEPSGKADAILEQAPEVEERFFVVPDIPHTELE